MYNPTRDGATPEHFSRWEREAKLMDTYSLVFVIKDCRTAAAAMQGWNPNREGFYLDQASTFGMELTRRNKTLPPQLRRYP
jgi:hypothetical protein